MKTRNKELQQRCRSVLHVQHKDQVHQNHDRLLLVYFQALLETIHNKDLVRQSSHQLQTRHLWICGFHSYSKKQPTQSLEWKRGMLKLVRYLPKQVRHQVCSLRHRHLNLFLRLLYQCYLSLSILRVTHPEQ